MAHEIGSCSLCHWKGEISEADQRTKNEILYIFCPNGCGLQVAPSRPLNASEDYFVNMFMQMFKEKKDYYERDINEGEN